MAEVEDTGLRHDPGASASRKEQRFLDRCRTVDRVRSGCAYLLFSALVRNQPGEDVLSNPLFVGS